MTAFIEFMNAPVGRAARLLLGVGLIYLGFAVIEGVTGSLVAGAGVAHRHGPRRAYLIEVVVLQRPRAR